MTGLLLLSIIGVWIAIVVFAMRRLARLFNAGWSRNVVVTFASVLMFLLPVADELLSRPAFDKLCEEHAKLKFDPQKIRGKTIFLADDPQPQIDVGFLNGYFIQGRYLDVTTKEVLVEARSYYIKGGFFIRMLGISEKDHPLTMRAYCASTEEPWQKSFLERYDVKRIQRKEIK